MSIEEGINEAVYYLSKPVWKATEFFLINDSSWRGTASKVFGIVAMIFAAPFAIVGEALHAASQRYFQRPYLSYKGPLQTSQDDMPKKLMTFNACMFPGGLPTPFGGMSTASARMDRMVQFLQAQNADIICMQEVSLEAAKQLIDKLKHQYSCFYYRIGPNPFQMETMMFWISKHPPLQEPTFIPFNIPGAQKGIRRGFFVAEFEKCYVVTTHLDPGVNGGEIRVRQIEAILKYIELLQSKPLFLMGDLNIEPEDIKAHTFLKDNFQNFQTQDVSNPTEANATCLDNCSECVRDPILKPKWTVIDHILVHNLLFNIVNEKIPTFDLKNLPGALSDHHAVVLVVNDTRSKL
ncbi:MAG: endonuclease/exonuclease/phosphatase family protein [Rhabdochlamydiaceae bacterium]